MPGVTVEELWQEALPAGTVLAAGQSGLGREVTWPALLRSRPPAFDPLRGGEIALVSLEIARMLDERLTIARIVRSLLEMSVSAIAVAGMADEEAKLLAEKAGTPLLMLPQGTNLRRVEQSITRAVIDRRSELYQSSQEIYQQLTELVIAGRGVPAIVERLAELTGRPIALEDDGLNLRVYAAAHNRGPSRDQLSRALEESRHDLKGWLKSVPPSASDPPTAKFVISVLGLTRITAPIVSRDKIAGYLSIFSSNGGLGELERLAVARGAAACAIEMVKEWAVLEAEDRLHVDLVDDLLSGEFTSEEALQNRAKRLGFDINRLHAVLALRPGVAKDTRGRAPESITGSALQRVVERELGTRGVTPMIGLKNDELSVLYPLAAATEPAALKTLVADVARAIAAQAGANPSVGIGRLYPGLDGIRAAHREAQQALAMGDRIFGPGHVTFFGDLGLYRLLFGIKDVADLRAFHDETLAKLVAYDGRGDGELAKTLAAYFACHNSPTDAARRLHVHRNTLLYRLRRIQEITGFDLDDAEVCLTLHLALHVKDVLKAMPQ